MVILIILSNIIANFFKEPILRIITPIMSLLLVVNAFSIIQRTILVKKIDFKLQARISIIASVVSGLIGIGMALFKFGIWSLVAQQFSRQILLSFFLWVFGEWRPRLIFSKHSFVELFGFGSRLLITNLISTFYQNIFLMIIGKIYSSDQLGKYARADQFNTIFTNNLTIVIQKVSFPALSSIQNDRQRLTHIFRKTLIYSAIITFALVFGIAAIAKPLILILIGEKWIESIVYLQIMCFYGALYPLQSVNINMLNIQGRSDLLLYLELSKKLLFIPVLIIGLLYTLKAMIISAAVYYYLEFIFNSYFSERFFGYGTIKQVKDLLPIYLISILVGTFMFCITLIQLPIILTLIIQCLIFLITIPLCYEIFKIEEYYELKQIVINSIRSALVSG